jgi:WD40 repeat protein
MRIRRVDAMVKIGNDPFNNVAIDPRGRWIATGKAQPFGSLGVWDAEMGRRLHVVSGHARRIVDLVFDAEGRRLVTTDGEEVRLWDCTRWTSRRIPHDRAVRTLDLALGPAGRYVYALTGRGVERWDLDGDERWVPVVADTAAHYRMAIAPDGGRIFVAGDQGDVRVYDLETGAMERVVRGRHRHPQPAERLRDDSVTGLAIGGDGCWLFAATGCEVTMWDTRTFAVVDRISVYPADYAPGLYGKVECLAAANGRLLVGCVVGTLIYENTAR